ncbi:hypothetical protein Cgig2_025583 [Carnegiea gigantea]|uniref:Uncharacterized protein n=1 Tax=Carnegiea gigantea TaxID=171969 RepID=A0A9Q1GHR7_9CARY|nr:hypothetical protein Cgig2_025583 [Carnegiea gigantea]
MATGSRSRKGKEKMVMGTETQDQFRRLQEEMPHFEQLAGYESVQSQRDVEVDGCATQSNTERQVELQQPNSQPIIHITGPQPTRPYLHPNRDGTSSNKGKQNQTSWVCNFFTKVSVPNMPGEFKSVCRESGTIARHLETHSILKDYGISLNQAQIFGFQGQKPAQFTTTGISPGLMRYKTRVSNYVQCYYQKLDVPYDVSRIMNDNNNLLQFLYDKYSEDAQPATPQTATQPMPSVPVSQLLYDTLVRGPGVYTTSGLKDQPRPEDDEDEIDQFVQLSFSSGSELMMSDVLLYLPYSTSSRAAIRRHLNMKYFN